MPHPGLYKALQYLKLQVIDSLPDVDTYFPYSISSPFDYWLIAKDLVTYKNDPKGIETFKSLATLAEENFLGDCDCFTIMTLAVLEIKTDWPQIVVLAGKGPKHPTHIYSGVNWKGNFISLDLTNPMFNFERNYKYKQYLDFKI